MSDTEDNVKSKKPEDDEEAGDEDKKEKKAPRTKAKTFEVKKWNAVCLWTYGAFLQQHRLGFVCFGI
jgi:hypothetical protein